MEFRSEVCLYSYVLKLDAKDIFCTKAAARLTSQGQAPLRRFVRQVL